MRAFILGHVNHRRCLGEQSGYDEYEFTATSGERVIVRTGGKSPVEIDGVSQRSLDALTPLHLSLRDVVKEYEIQSLMCRCGCHDLTNERGPLGEIVHVCKLCGEVVSAEFEAVA